MTADQSSASREVRSAAAHDSFGKNERAEAAAAVSADRGIPSVNRARSLQARISNVLAIGLISTLGLGFLAWYYTRTLARHAQTQEDSVSDVKDKAKGEMTLPVLGKIEPPPPAIVERVLGPEPAKPDELSGSFDMAEADWAVRREPAVSARSAPSADDVAHVRRLSGPAFASSARQGGSAQEPRPVQRAVGPVEGSPSHQGAAAASIDSLLEPSYLPVAHASALPTQRLLLAKGSFLDCTLETAIDSSLPGLTTCVLATDAFSADGSVVLLERGSKLIGETRGDVRQGSSRIFVLWTEARTPDGVVVPLASPGTDELGRAGLPGEVDRHFFERFGAAILISIIDGAVQAAVQSSRDGATVIFNPSTSRDIMTEVLRGTVNIPPTVRKPNGDRIQVLVARDLDFRSVYELRPDGGPG